MPRQRKRLLRARRVAFEPLEARQLLTAAWRNPVDAIDVNNDRQVDALDAIAIINELNSAVTYTLPPLKPAGEPFLDPTGENELTAFDALAVINYLNIHPIGTYVLQERVGQFADELSVLITAGSLPAGTREYRLRVQPQFDLSDTQSGSEDLFVVSLLNAATGQTVIDAGTPGSNLFSLRGPQATVSNGLVQWDGTFLSIDLSGITAETLELRLQLLNHDADRGSLVTITPWSNVIDPLGVPRSPGTLRSPPGLPAGAVANVNSYLQMPTLRVEMENAIYNSSTGRFTAELRLANDTEAVLTNGIVHLPGISAALAVNESGLIGTEAYWSFASVIGPPGLAAGAKSGWLKIELDLQGNSFLWRPIARGFTSTEQLAQLGVFSTNFSEARERQIFHMPLNAGERFLTLPMKSPSTTIANGASLRLLLPDRSQDFFYPDNYFDRFNPYLAESTGDYQFEMTAVVPGDYRIAFQKLGNLPELSIGSEVRGYIDPRLPPKVFAFYGTEGQRLVFENRHPVDATQYMNWQVIEPFGNEEQFIAQTIPGGNLAVELNYSGLHYLILRGPSNNNQFLPYDYILRNPVAFETPLTLGIAQDAEFQSFNETRAYTFTGALGDQVILDMLIANGNLNTYLVNPYGAKTEFIPFQPFLIDVAGNWKVAFEGTTDESFVFRMVKAADLNSLTHGLNIDANVNPIRSDFFRVSAVRGERLTLVNNSAAGVLTQMYSPAGALLPQTGPNQFHVNETGDQLLRIYTNTTSTLAYDFTLQTNIDAPVTHSGFDVEYTGTLNTGTTTIGTFTASAGMQWMYDKFALAYDTSGFTVTITGPGFNQTFNKDSDVITLARSGTYTIQATNAGSVAAPYGFRLIDLAAAPLLTDGEQIEETFNGGGTLVWRVEGTVGERLLLAALDNSAINNLLIQLKTDAGVGFNWAPNPYVGDYAFVATKTHYLTIEQRYSHLPDLRLVAALTTEAEVLPLDTPFSGTLGPNGGLRLFQFEAQRGDRLIIDALAMSGNLNVATWDGSDRTLDLNRPELFHISVIGKNYIWLRPWSALETSYTLHASFESDTATPIALDAIVSGTLTEGESRNYSLDVAANSVLLFDGLDVANPAHVNIFDEQGFSVYSNVDTRADRMIYSQVGGKYKISVSNSTLPFSFRVIDVRNAPLLPLNTDLQGTIVADGNARIRRFPATEAQRLYVDSNASALLPFRGSMTLYSPFGGQQATTSASTNNDLNVATWNTGNQYLVISADSTFNYELRVRTSETTIVPIALGSTISGVLRDPGDMVEYVFQGTRGQHIHLEGITNAFFRIVDPNGAVLPTTEGFGSLLPMGGEYRIRVYSGSNQFNMDYRFQLADVATLPSVPLNTPISGSTTQGGWLMYRLPAAVGDRIQFDSQHFSGPTVNNSWRLLSPQATFVIFPVLPFIDGDRTITLNEAGDYVLVVRLPGGAIDYAFQVNTIAQPAVTVAGLNQSYSGTVTNAAVVNVPFTGTGGQRVLLDVLDNADLPGARLLGPDGSVVVLGNNDAGSTSDQLLVLPVSGTYQLEISAAGSPTPRNYRFRLIDASALPLTPLDTPFAIDFALPYQGNIWAFEGTNGDQLAIELDLAQFAAGFRIVQPNGKELSFLREPPQIVPLTQTGRHYLVMDGQGITPFSETGRIWNTHNLPLITSEDPINVHFTGRDWHFYSFNLTAGERVFFTPLTSAPSLLQFNFVGPGGVKPTISLHSETNPSAFTVTQEGRYTLILKHNSTTPIDFTFQIHILPLREVFGVARE